MIAKQLGDVGRFGFQTQELFVFVGPEPQSVRFLVGGRFCGELFRGADYILVLAPPAVQFFATAEHPHGTKRSFFFAQHAAVVADTLVVIVTQMTLLCALSRPASPCAEFT
jgi:hypothetical protein